MAQRDTQSRLSRVVAPTNPRQARLTRGLETLDRLRRRTERAPPSVLRDLAEALGALLGRRVGGRLFAGALDQRRVGRHDEEVDDRRDDDERDQRVEELAVEKPAVVDVEVEAGEIGLRSEEHTSELQSHVNLVCRLLL